jgi:hypothetical protein
MNLTKEIKNRIKKVKIINNMICPLASAYFHRKTFCWKPFLLVVLTSQGLARQALYHLSPVLLGIFKRGS